MRDTAAAPADKGRLTGVLGTPRQTQAWQHGWSGHGGAHWWRGLPRVDGPSPRKAHRGSGRRPGVPSAGNSGSQAPEHGLKGRVQTLKEHMPRQGQGQGPPTVWTGLQRRGPGRASCCLDLQTVLMEDASHAAVRGWLWARRHRRLPGTWGQS